MTDREQIRRDAEDQLKASWVHHPMTTPEDLARHCLALLAELKQVPALVEALQEIRDREPDKSSSDQTAFFWSWAKRVANDALAAYEQAQHDA